MFRSNWWLRLSRSYAFPLGVWIGTWKMWNVFDTIQNFIYDWSPWSLQYRLEAMKKENSALCEQLQDQVYQNFELKRTLAEAMKKIHMPFSGRQYPLGKQYTYGDQVPPIKTFALIFDAWKVAISLDMHSFPRYSADLLDWMAQETSHQLVDHMRDHVYQQVKAFYQKEFIGDDYP